MVENNKNYLEFLSAEEVRRIHSESLSILEETGVKVLHDDALNWFADAGARVDFANRRVRIPGDMVETYMAKAPESFTVHASADGAADLELKPGKVNFVTTHGIPFVYDLETGERRQSSCDDARAFSKLSDSLINLADAYCVFHPLDVQNHAIHAHIVHAQIENSGKPIKGRINGKQIAEDCLKMAEMVAGGKKALAEKPILHALVSSLSPLTMDNVQIEGMAEYIRAGQPVNLSAAIGAGSTGPVTLVGTMVLLTTEILAHGVLAQIIKPGAPIMYGSASSTIDMRNASLRYGAVESGMLSSAVAQMSRFYKIPCRVSAGATDSKMLDMQAGFESSMNLLMAALSGASYISNAAGAVDLALTASYEKLVIDHEIISSIVRVIRGISVNDETLSGDLIKSVGPGGQFLTAKHTFSNFKKEIFFPGLVDSGPYQAWEGAENKDIKDRAREMVKTILRKHEGPSRDEKLLKELEAYVKSVDDRVVA